MSICWICKRRLPRGEMTFVEIEDDGCGEYECANRRSCYLYCLETWPLGTGRVGIHLSSPDVDEIDPEVRRLANELLPPIVGHCPYCQGLLNPDGSCARSCVGVGDAI